MIQDERCIYLTCFTRSFCWRVCKGPHAPVTWFLWHLAPGSVGLWHGLVVVRMLSLKPLKFVYGEVLDKLQYKDPNMTLFGNSKRFKFGQSASVPHDTRRIGPTDPTTDRSWKPCTISWLSWNGWISAWVKILIVLIFYGKLK